MTTLVLKADGSFVPLSQIVVGDRVICNGEPTPVIAVHRAGKKRCYKVVFEDGGSIEASAEHEFPIAFGSGKKFIKRALSSLIGRKVSVSKKARMLSYKNINFETKSMEIHPYLLGALIGDGTLKNNFRFSNIQTPVLERVAELLLQVGHRLSPINKCDYNIVSIMPLERVKGRFGRSWLRTKMGELGLLCNAKNKFIPDNYKTASVEDRRQLLAGLIDTDGSKDEFCSVSERLAKDFVYLIKSLGGKSSYSKKVSGRFVSYRVYWRLNDKLPLALSYKQTSTKRMPEYANRVVKHIVEIDQAECGDLTVAHPDHCFVAGDWVVVGNSGKTTSGGLEFLFHATGLYPDWYPVDQRYKHPVKGRIVAKDFQKGVGEVVVPFLEEWLDMSLVAKKYRNPIGIPIKWTLKNGSEFDILTHEQNTEQFEGWRGHVAWFDEPPPRDKYIATVRGLVDFNGRNWLTLTPLTQPWIYDEIFTRVDNKRVFVVVTDIRDNPHLKEESILEFELKMTEEEKEARLHGRFLHLTGLIYKEFRPDIHIVSSIDVKPSWTRYFAIDPHTRTPTACLWLAVDPEENHWIYDELWLKDMDVEQIAHAIHAQEGDMPAHVRLIDPHADQDNGIVGGFNIRKELMKHGIYTQRGNSDPSLGKARIKQALKPRYSHLRKADVPQLRVSRECTQTIYEFQHYIWDDYRKREEYNLKELPKKRFDHFMDCFDDKTEVLTKRGWLPFAALQCYDEVMTVDLKRDMYEFQKPTEYIEREHSGEMVKISSRRGVFLVTPNHRMIIYGHTTKGKSSKYNIKLAKDLSKVDTLKTCAQWTGVHYKSIFGEDSLRFARFLGWYVAEGNLEKPQFPGHGYGVVISQIPGAKSDEILELCRSFRWRFNRSGNKIYASSKELWNFLKPFGINCYTKVIPQIIKEASPDIIEQFIQGLVAGDGWIQNGKRTIATTSVQLADDVQELFLKLGRTASVRVRKAEPYSIRGRTGNNTVDQFWIAENKRDMCLRNASGDSLISSVSYNGKVYCVSVPNQTLLVRRNGKPLIAGNCLRYVYNHGPRYIQPEEQDTEIRYEGKYTKHAVEVSTSKYHELVEGGFQWER